MNHNQYNAKEILDPRTHAVGSIIETYKKYTHLINVLPAMGYGNKQINELEETINKVDCDVVISGTPIDLKRIININKPIIRIRYDVGDETSKELEIMAESFLMKNNLL